MIIELSDFERDLLLEALAMYRQMVYQATPHNGFLEPWWSVGHNRLSSNDALGLSKDMMQKLERA